MEDKVSTTIWIRKDLKRIAKEKGLNLSKVLNDTLVKMFKPEEVMFGEYIDLKKKLKVTEDGLAKISNAKFMDPKYGK